MKNLICTCLAALVVALSSACSLAGDWPQWRYDAGRGAVSPDDLPERLHLQWTRRLPPPRPAWPESQPALRFDVSYSPVVAGKLLFVPSMVTDTVIAYDTDTGAERWRFYTDGPVRLAPIAHNGKVYFGSDDGYLYCVDASRGTLVWRFRGGPSDRKVLGNGRLISTWPVRGGPVLLDGTIYFTAGIWPFMGIFAHAVDARTGKSVWTNSGEGSTYQIQPHNSPAFSGLAPRGYLAATVHGVVAPGGRTPPGCYDLKTGKLKHFDWTKFGNRGWQVTARGQWFFHGGRMVSITDGEPVRSMAAMLHDDAALYGMSGGQIFGQALQAEQVAAEKVDRKGRKVQVKHWTLKEPWKLPVADAPGQLFLKAGSRFYAGGDGMVAAIQVDSDEKVAKVVWKGAFEGTPWNMLATDDKLFVVTVDGRIYCFGGTACEQAVAHDFQIASKQQSGPWRPHAEAIIKTTQATEGYCLMLGLGTGGLAEELVRASKLHVIAISPDAERVSMFRRRMQDAGLYGIRVAAHVGDPVEYPLPPYLARLVVSEDLRAAGIDRDDHFVKSVFRALRPYGGMACLPIDVKRLGGMVKPNQLERGLPARIERPGRPRSAIVKSAGKGWSLLVREGALPGAADWTHNYGDAGNSVVSKDRRVKLPLGLLWFGGPPNDEVLPRHGHGPSPQVAAGRLFIEGRNMLRALDIYTGRLLWQKDLPDLGKFYDNTNHQPGAGEIGSNYVSLEDAVYVVYGRVILELDPADGETRREFKLPTGPDGRRPYFGAIAACGNLLIVTSVPVKVTPKPESSSVDELLIPVRYSSASRRLAVFDRKTGEKLWDRRSKYGFRHNNIAVGAEKLFCIDGLSRAKKQVLLRCGFRAEDYKPRLMALSVRTGEELWSTGKDVFGTFLNYSTEHDVLLQAGSAARDRARDEATTGMVAYQGKDGKVLWKDLQRSYSGPCMLHHDMIITQGTAYSLLTGKPKMRDHPITGRPVPWKFTRNYGCNTATAGEYLILFRSAAAGFYDLASDGGTGNFGGFKSGCTSNLVAAGGLLGAPEYTRTCICNYQNQTSLALVHDPQVEIWTFNALDWDGKPVRRVGINFGAPGDRLADNGTLWLDYPSRGGPSPDIPVDIEAPQPEYFRYHSSRVQADPDGRELDWVAASGFCGAGTVTLMLAKDDRPRKYTVRLHFAEMEDLQPGRRVFDVLLQGAEVLGEFDIVKEAGGANRAVVKEFQGIEVTGQLKVSLAPCGKEGCPPPVLCGIEVVAEEK